MYAVHGIPEENGQASARIYLERFPGRHQPHPSLFAQYIKICASTGY